MHFLWVKLESREKFTRSVCKRLGLLTCLLVGCPREDYSSLVVISGEFCPFKEARTPVNEANCLQEYSQVYMVLWFLFQKA